MGAFDFGTSWIKIIANPAGYSAQRKSPQKAAEEYIKSNPPTLFLEGSLDELSYKENRKKWVDGCASKLKSDDVGKSIANCQKACAGVFDSSTESLKLSNGITAGQVQRQLDTEADVKRKEIIMFSILVILSGVLIIFLIAKSK